MPAQLVKPAVSHAFVGPNLRPQPPSTFLTDPDRSSIRSVCRNSALEWREVQTQMPMAMASRRGTAKSGLASEAVMPGPENVTKSANSGLAPPPWADLVHPAASLRMLGKPGLTVTSARLLRIGRSSWLVCMELHATFAPLIDLQLKDIGS
jgi:hypothetical protein